MRQWAFRGVPGISPEAAGLFRIVFNLLLLVAIMTKLSQMTWPSPVERHRNLGEARSFRGAR